MVLDAHSPGVPPKAARWANPGGQRRVEHHPGLDGVRGASVAAVLLFHGGFPWATGGYLGVSTFFTLSGFLITSLLMQEWASSGSIHLGRFWARRLRRLLPAVLATLLGVALYATFVSDPDQLERVRIYAFATLGYLANWCLILAGESYADLFAAPNPLLHAWSLAVEEQFYLFFPLVVAGVMDLARGRRRVLAMVLGVFVASSVAMSLVLQGDRIRVYYGTDTRIAEILLGSLLALWAAGPGKDLAVRRRPALALGGLVAGAATLLAWSTVEHTNPALYAGGFGLYGASSTLLVAAAVAPGPMRTLLSFAPLRWLGLISYGVYLYHWPIFLWLTPVRTGLSLPLLFVVRLSITLLVAVVSYRLLEQPIRRGALAGSRALALAFVTIVLTIVALVVTTVPPPAPSRLVAETATQAEDGASITPPLFGEGLRAATAADPLRVLLVGDSVSYDAEPALLAILAATGATKVTALNRLGFGLSRSKYDWRSDWARLVEESRPELVVAFFGFWDEEFLAGQGPEAYARILDENTALLTAGGAKLLLVGMPVSLNRAGEVLPRAVPAAFLAAANRHAKTTAFLDLSPALSPGDRYTAYLDGPGGRERVRKADATHLCPAGSARIARAVFDAVSASWDLPLPAVDWRAGDWALDPRFNDPRGACPK